LPTDGKCQKTSRRLPKKYAQNRDLLSRIARNNKYPPAKRVVFHFRA